MDDPVMSPQPPPQIVGRQEALVEDLRIQIEANILGQQVAFLQRLDDRLHSTGQKAEAPDPQLELLRSIRDRIEIKESKTTTTQFVWNAILQTIALVIGILFGVFSILSYSISQTSLSQSLAANKLALLSLCLSSPNSSTTQDTCNAIFEQASTSFASVATTAFSLSPTETTFPSQNFSAPNSGSNLVNLSVMAGLVDDGVCAAVWLESLPRQCKAFHDSDDTTRLNQSRGRPTERKWQ